MGWKNDLNHFKGNGKCKVVGCFLKKIKIAGQEFLGRIAVYTGLRVWGHVFVG
jgi:hypothetical protein